MSYAHPMNHKPIFEYQTSIADLLEQYPECIPVFLRHRMICVGCTLAPFDTLGDAIYNYDLSPEDFIEELRGVVKSIPKE